MSTREFIALGTGSQVPGRYRNHNGYMLLWDGVGLMFDPGEGTQRQMIRPGVSASQIHHILITHFHGDHCLGFSSMVQRLSLDGVTRDVHVHYPESGQVYYDRLRQASIFHDKTQLKPDAIAAGGIFHRRKEFTLEARALEHGVDCYGYRLQEPDDVQLIPERLDALGVRGRARADLKRDGKVSVDGKTVLLKDVSIPRPGQSFAFVMDTKMCDAAIDLAQGVDLLVCESTYLDEHKREAGERGHLTASQAATIAKEAGARQLVLTHFSQRYTQSQPFLDEAGKIFGNVIAARDGMRVPFPKRVP